MRPFSGQNVGYPLGCRRAAPGPGSAVRAVGAVRGARRLVRRVDAAEPSVLRAGMMATLGATAYALGREREAVRSLAVAVVVLLLVDPLLAWSVGFWLSVGATAGVTGVGPWLAGRLHRLGPLAMPVAVTIGAQAGVAVPSILVFGRLSLVGTVANLVAVPIAGLVMLYGLPASLLAGAVPVVGALVMAPVGWGARWVDAVATVAAAVEPPAPWSWVGWVLVAGGLAGMVRAGSRHELLRRHRRGAHALRSGIHRGYGGTMADEREKSPGMWYLLAEARAPLEAATLVPALPMLMRRATRRRPPRGGHPPVRRR